MENAGSTNKNMYLMAAACANFNYKYTCICPWESYATGIEIDDLSSEKYLLGGHIWINTSTTANSNTHLRTYTYMYIELLAEAIYTCMYMYGLFLHWCLGLRMLVLMMYQSELGQMFYNPITCVWMTYLVTIKVVIIFVSGVSRINRISLSLSLSLA